MGAPRAAAGGGAEVEGGAVFIGRAGKFGTREMADLLPLWVPPPPWSPRCDLREAVLPGFTPDSLGVNPGGTFLKSLCGELIVT